MAVQTGLPGSPGVPVPRAPYQGGPFGTPNVVVPCSASVDGATILMLPPQGPQWFVAGQLYDQQTFGGIALGTPVGDIQISIARFTLPLYDGTDLANGSIEIGDFFQVAYDSALGGFHLLNWTRQSGGSSGQTQIITVGGVVVVADDTGTLLLNKAAPSATPITLPSVDDRNGLPLVVSDFAGNGGDLTFTPHAGESIMGLPTAVLASTGQGVGSAASITFYPSTDLQGWYTS